MATPATTATGPAAAIVTEETPSKKKELTGDLAARTAELAAAAKQNTQFRAILNQLVRTHENSIDASTREELFRRLITEAKRYLENPKKPEKAAPVPKVGIETNIQSLVVKVNKLFGEICEGVSAFVNTKNNDSLTNLKAKEVTIKGKEAVVVDTNSDKINTYIARNNELMQEYIKFFRTLNNKIAIKKSLIANHITVEKADQSSLDKMQKKLNLTAEKVRDHFDYQDKILAKRKASLTHLETLRKDITDAFTKEQREIHYITDCWASGEVISRSAWRSIGNAPLYGYSTDAKRLGNMYRIENIEKLLPKPVAKPPAATPVTPGAPAVAAPVAAPPPAAVAAPKAPATEAVAPAVAPAAAEAAAASKKKKKKEKKEKAAVAAVKVES